MTNPARFPTSRQKVILGLWAGIVVLPFLISFSAEWALQLNGCSFDLKAGTMCMIGTMDWGRFLGQAFLLGRFVGLVGLGSALVVIPIWLLNLRINGGKSKRTGEQ